ncbi:MAG: hypothetical protein WBJ84_07500 [Bacteroidales bacterium]
MREITAYNPCDRYILNNCMGIEDPLNASFESFFMEDDVRQNFKKLNAECILDIMIPVYKETRIKICLLIAAANPEASGQLPEKWQKTIPTGTADA